jgi:hypothetical protein
MELLREEVDHEDTPLLKYNLPKFIHRWETHEQYSS